MYAQKMEARFREGLEAVRDSLRKPDPLNDRFSRPPSPHFASHMYIAHPLTEQSRIFPIQPSSRLTMETSKYS